MISTRFPRTRTQGAILFETVLALGLFAAAAAIIIGGLNRSIASLDRQRLNAQATDLAISVLSELQLGIRNSNAAGPESFPYPFEGFSWELQWAPFDGPRVASLRRVEVKIEHGQSGAITRLMALLSTPEPEEELAEGNDERSIQTTTR